ncbi:MAG TPA: MFS transporter [Gemmatimonadales bacterium]|nr:MFS transporter [Gemmatimonadales bacterium]
MTAVDVPMASDRDVPKVIWSWAFYDWANSAFTTLVVTFIYATYFTQAMAPDPLTGTGWWSRAVATSAVLIALLSPVLGAMADRGGTRKRFLAISTLTCVLATTLLAFVAPGGGREAFLALACFVVANVAFEMSVMFCNAFLPAIASSEKIGRISGYGWGLGYVGGLLCMAIALVGFVQPEVPWFGLSKEAGWNVRATNLLVAGWFLAFSIPFFLNVPEKAVPGGSTDVRGAFRALAQTVRDIRRYRDIVRFLIAHLIYNDGLVTVFAFGAIYAAGTFGMTIADVILFGVVLNVASGLGAIGFGFVDDKIGGKNAVLVSLVGLIAAAAIAVWAPTRDWFWVAGVLIGIFVGPNQSSSRSLLGRFVPERHQTEFFGLYAFSGKAAAFLGPLLLGAATTAFASQRAGMATVIVFFVIGGAVMLTVDERRGIAAAQAE